MSTDQQIEQEIQAKGLIAPRITPADLTANIVTVEYVKHIAPSGQVLRWCVITTENGFAVTGRPSASVSPENDDETIGKQVAYENAKQELWPLMGYALRERLHADQQAKSVLVCGDGMFRKKPVVIAAAQWFKNGDHPADYAEDRNDFHDGNLVTITGEHRKAQGWEGDVVRYYRRPDDSGERACRHCGNPMHVHGWIDTKEGGHIVCPGDWIITGVKGERYPCKPDIFSATYEAVA